MALIHNNLKDLQKENSISIKTIRSDQNRNEVTRMIQYLSSSHLSLFQIEVIQKDLIGIALEADREQMTMSEKLGISMKEFCDGIIQSTEEYPARRERIYQEVVTAVQYLFYLYAIEYIIFQSVPAHWGISIQLTVGLLVFLTLNRMTSLYIRNRLSLHPKAYMRSMYNVGRLYHLCPHNTPVPPSYPHTPVLRKRLAYPVSPCFHGPDCYIFHEPLLE